MKNKFGFTLAEVLITLVIVGVVAALTIPNLIHNHEKRVWAEALKVNYQLLSDGFKRMLALEGASLLADTTVFQSIASSDCTYYGTGCGEFYNKFGKYFSIAKVTEDVKEYKFLNGSTTTFSGDSLVLANGAVIFNQKFSKGGGSWGYGLTGSVSDFYIDVNGRKGPNTVGRDIFYLFIYNDGTVLSAGSKLWVERTISAFSALMPNIDFSSRLTTMHWSGSDTSANCLTKSEGSNDSQGLGCGGRIMEEGWRMTY